MTQVIPSPVYGSFTAPGLLFAPDATGIAFAGWNAPPLVFPAQLTGDLSRLFPSLVPEPEKLIWEYVHDATQYRAVFPEQLTMGLTLPAAFNVAPDIDSASGTIPVVRGWPAYPGEVPAIGVAMGPETEDPGEGGMAGGFVGDAYILDNPVSRNILATASYFAEPLYSQTIVELIHTNRDERDRLHNELRRILFPLRRILPSRSGLIWKVQVDAEKQEIDQDEAPIVAYVSIFTVHVWFEMWTATDVATSDAIVEQINVTVDPT